MAHPLYIVGGPRRFRKPGGPEEWGTPKPLLHRSITNYREQELVRHVVNDVHYRDVLLNIHRMKAEGAQIRDEVELRHFDPRLRGDVDVLVIPPNEPERSTAIQIKRFEASVAMDAKGNDVLSGGTPERWRKLMAKGVKQANRTKAIGFAQVYLWIFVAVDTRARNNGWYTYDGPNSVLRSQLENAIFTGGMAPEIGVMKFEWVQPMDRQPFELSTYGGSLKHLAATTPQPPSLTERIRALPPIIVQP